MQILTEMKELTNSQKMELNLPIVFQLSHTKMLTPPPTIYIKTPDHPWTPPYTKAPYHLQPYLIKYDRAHTLELTARTFPNINKWTSDENIDIETSTTF
jgi:hypothetical protein